MATIDDNSGVVALAYDGTDVVPLKVDPATGRLLISVLAAPSGSATPGVKIDNNRGYVALAADSNGDARPLLCDASGYLVLDLTV